MTKNNKDERLNEIKTAIKMFSERYLNEEFYGYSLHLCNMLGRKRTLSITGGRQEIWAAAIIYVIARLNFLFDHSNKFHLTADIICDFFGVKKSTASQKATFIETVCKIRLGEPSLCTSDISDMFTFYQTPEGLIIPKIMLKPPDIVIKSAKDKNVEKSEKYTAEQQQIREQKKIEKKTNRTKINQNIAKTSETKNHKEQIELFDDI